MLLFLEKLPGHSIFSEHRGEYFPRRHDFPSPSLAESAGEFFILRQNVWESACGGFWYSRYIAHCPPAGSGGFHHNAAVSSPARETKGEKWRERPHRPPPPLSEKKGFGRDSTINSALKISKLGRYKNVRQQIRKRLFHKEIKYDMRQNGDFLAARKKMCGKE